MLIKDNHIALAGGVRRAVELARQAVPHLMKIEVQVGNHSQLRDAMAAAADVIMLENMNIAEIRESVALIRAQRPDVTIEASVGASLETVREIAECGVDFISVSAITQSATAVEISLKTMPL